MKDMKQPAILTTDIPHKALALWATSCAVRVLSLFEEVCPNEEGPRQAIAAAREWTEGKLSVPDARKAAFASHAAARQAGNNAAAYAARSCAHAAASAHVARHAVYAASYALKAVRASGGNEEGEKQWQCAQYNECNR